MEPIRFYRDQRDFRRIGGLASSLITQFLRDHPEREGDDLRALLGDSIARFEVFDFAEGESNMKEYGEFWGRELLADHHLRHARRSLARLA